jgi:hypothetical protein
MYHDGMRDVAWKRKVGREGERGRAREVKNIESERIKRTNDRVIWSLLSTVAVDHSQYIVLI